MPHTLRDYQVAGLAQLERSHAQGRRRQVYVQPTGTGKTTVIAELVLGAQERGLKTLVVAHRKEIIDQLVDRLEGQGVIAGAIMRGHPRNRPDLPTQVASIQTLARRPAEQWPEASLIVIDEVQHACARTYRRLFDRYPSSRFVGFTATPWREDGQGLGELYDDVVVALTPSEATAKGWLCPYTGYAYRATDASKVRTKGKDYDPLELARAALNPDVLGDILGQWLEHCAGKRTVIFAVNIEHAKTLQEQFAGAGVKAELLDHYLAKAEREALLYRFRGGITQVVVNVGILTEGFDEPSIEVVILARPTKSEGLYLQMVGRGLRPYAGKMAARIHDHAGCVERFGLPDEDRDYSLREARKTFQGKGLRKCFACQAIIPLGAVTCPGCGQSLVAGGAPKAAVLVGEGVAVDLETYRAGREIVEYARTVAAEVVAKDQNPKRILAAVYEKFPDIAPSNDILGSISNPMPKGVWAVYHKAKGALARKQITPEEKERLDKVAASFRFGIPRMGTPTE